MKRFLTLMAAILTMSMTTMACDTIRNDELDRYKLYPTTNMWTFLKLDTCLGKVWQVQYDINGDNRMQDLFIYSCLNSVEMKDALNEYGRFELHPTQNMFNFLLLDKKSGRIWQIQWSTDPDNRGVIAEIE